MRSLTRTRPLPRYFCGDCGKYSYKDRVDAGWALLECHVRGREEARVYACPHRRGWHLTSRI